MTDLNSPNLYFNRELSWLRFNTRVLAQAMDKTLPPLEKLKFLAIYGTNLDEFYMIRVAGLKALYKARIQQTGPDQMTPREQLDAIHGYLHDEQRLLESCYSSILEELEGKGVYIRSYPELGDAQQENIALQFWEQIYPVIIPIATDATHPFPHLNNLSFALALTLSDSQGNIKHGLIRIPRILPRFFTVDQTFVPIESIVENFIGELFPGYTKIASAPFRVTRNADIDITEHEADDFLEILEEGLRARNKGSLVRLELTEGADENLLAFLTSHLKLYHEDTYYYKGIPLNLGSFWQIVGDKALSHLILPTFAPKTMPPLDNDDIFEVIGKQSILLNHPYDSFDPVVKFITQASKDPQVLAIRMTLYRVGSQSPIVRALIDAARDGKQVTVLVELKARFDEENNLHWAKALEDAGAHVVYGIPNLKVHAKIAQVIRREKEKLRGYLHLATGNYNPSTAKIYTDISYFTTGSEYNSDATRFFHYLTGFAAHIELDRLSMSPTQIKPKLLKLIDRESQRGKEGHIILKANSLVDPGIIKALYKASRRGTKVDLIIRGICCLRPGVEGVSENIRVHSIIGKYLEHPRIYCFKHETPGCYISSADLMPRNLVRRVELMTPIEEPALAQKVEQILQLQLSDNQLRWELDSDGEYSRSKPTNKVINNHTILENYAAKLYNKTRKSTPEYINKLTHQILKNK